MCQLYLAPGRPAAARRRERPQDLCFFSLSLVLPGGARRFPVDRKFDGKGRPVFPGPLHVDPRPCVSE